MLPIASATQLGGVKIGQGIEIAPDGTASVTGAPVDPEQISQEGDAKEMLDEVFGTFTTGLIGEITGTVADALVEMAEVKADKVEPFVLTIPKTGWSAEPAATAFTDYPKFINISVKGVTARDVANVTIKPSSLKVASACGICPVSETLDGKIRLRSVDDPSDAISAECVIWFEPETKT